MAAAVFHKKEPSPVVATKESSSGTTPCCDAIPDAAMVLGAKVHEIHMTGLIAQQSQKLLKEERVSALYRDSIMSSPWAVAAVVSCGLSTLASLVVGVML